jgi:hypothetical protein
METKPILKDNGLDNSAVSINSSANTSNTLKTNNNNSNKNDGLNLKEIISGSIKKRHILTLYSFFGFFFAYSFRANLSVAIVDMARINTKIVTDLSNTSSNSSDKVNLSFILNSYSKIYFLLN